MVSHLNGCLTKLVYHKVPFLVHLFFLIYMNDLSDDLLSTVKLISDDTSLFFIVYDSKISVNDLNNDMQKITE